MKSVLCPIWQPCRVYSAPVSLTEISGFATWSVRLNPKWDKSGTFSDRISVHFGAPRQNVLKFDLKKSRICPIWANNDTYFGAKPCVPGLSVLQECRCHVKVTRDNTSTPCDVIGQSGSCN